MTNEVVFDIEADGLKPTKIHVLSLSLNGNIHSTNSYDKMRSFLSKEDNVLIGHNIIRFDIPALEKLLKIKVKARLVDTLALSWYLYPSRKLHGLEAWGDELGVPKPPIDDWEGLSYEEYKHRCESDVKINTLLWDKMKACLEEIYEGDGYWRLIDYLSFKLDCAREQERSRWLLNKPLAEDSLRKLQEALQKATESLAAVMPPIPINVTKRRPAKPYKKNGELSAIGEKWFGLLEELGMPEDTKEVSYVSGYEPPNPASNVQIKDWLDSLGWEPCTFKFVRDKVTGDVRQIPQIRKKNDSNEPVLTPSVERLIEKEPSLVWLKEVGVLKHRSDVFSGFLRDEEEGFLCARIAGLTNTLRFKHSEIVNPPGVDKPWGHEIRGSLVARDGYVLCGSDMSSLEDRTKQHYIYPYDPEYVKQMQRPDYDPHLDLAYSAGAITQKDIDLHIAGTVKCALRKVFKAVNYACVYGAGGATVARSAGVSKPEGDNLVVAYWKRNWAVKAVADSCRVRRLPSGVWLLNPVSNLWYSLRHEKDAFSTLNQGTGVWCFDTWVRNVRKVRKQLTGQFHDEIIIEIPEGREEDARALLRKAIDDTNEELRLNVKLDIDIQFGKSYAEIH